MVLFAAYPHVFGGPERGLQLLARGLMERGWSVEVVLPGDGVAAERFRHAGLDVDLVNAPAPLLVYGKAATRGRRAAEAAVALPLYWRRLRRRIRHADIAHYFGHRGFVMAGPAARTAGVPSVWHVGGWEPGGLVNEAGAITAGAVIAVSRYAAEKLPHRARPTVVPNAVDPAAFEGRRDARDAGDVPATVVCATRLTPEKGVDVLLRAAALLRPEVPDLRVVIFGATQAGHEAYRAELDALAARLGLGDTVSFAGPVDHPFRRWAGARVYVQPSREEGFGLAAAEAMASGLPVVASATGGLVEVLDDGRAGVLVPPDDAEALAAAVTALLEDADEASRLGAAGRARAAACYSVDAMVDGVEGVYRRLLSRG